MHVKEYLKDYLQPISTAKEKRIKEYVTTVAPQFRHLLKYKPEKVSQIKPKLNEDKLDDALYEIKREFDKEIKKENKVLFEQLDETSMTAEEYEAFFKGQIEKISDGFNKSYNAYFEVLSYDKILNDAKKRNQVLFDKLGI